MSAPANTTADRLDRVQVGQSINFAPIVLTAPTPDDGWLVVTGVSSDGATVTVEWDEGTYSSGVASLIRIGWS